MYNYAELLEKSKMPSLKVRRLRSIAIETFKIIHKESPIYLHDLVNIKKQDFLQISDICLSKFNS
jgi:hypothetical protein